MSIYNMCLKCYMLLYLKVDSPDHILTINYHLHTQTDSCTNFTRTSHGVRLRILDHSYRKST